MLSSQKKYDSIIESHQMANEIEIKASVVCFSTSTASGTQESYENFYLRGLFLVLYCYKIYLLNEFVKTAQLHEEG